MGKKATCQICNRKIGMRGISSHLRTHDLTFGEYLEDYVDFVPGYDRCGICGTPTGSKGNKEFTTCSRSCQAEWKRRNWQGENAPRYGKPHTENTKKKIGKKAKERLSDPENHPMYGKHHSDETKRKISEAHIKLYEGDYENPMKGKTHDLKTIKKIFSSWEDSTREKEFMEILEGLNIDYIHQFFLSRENTNKSYDFYLKEFKTLVEVDGDYWHGGPAYKEDEYFSDVKYVKMNDKFKNQFAKENGYNIIRFWGSEVKDNPEKIKQSLTNLKTTNKLK